jgi:hypothetical protein
LESQVPSGARALGCKDTKAREEVHYQNELL